ncbi:AAA family ATPase, partial [Fusobacterium necrophorum]
MVFSLKIDLSKKDVFEDKELEINRNITFIFGKNGTGKSTIAKLIEEQEKGYDVRIFNGFDGVISENGELNAVILGEENTQIQKEISEKEKEIEKETIKKEEVLKQIQEPENKADKNVFTKFKNAEKEWESKKQEMENFFTESASKIKRKDNPQIAKTTYNKKDFKEELKKAERLDENKIKELKEIIKQEIKNPVNICFPALNLENYLKKTNEILATRVEEKTRISRLEGNREKREFAEQGYHIHKKGDICAFCGNEIQDEIFVELEKYFSSDEVKEFKEKIQVEKGRIEETIKEIDNIVIDKNQFYMEYEKEVEDLKEEFQSIK